MKPLTLSVSVFLVLQRTFHRTECNENAIVQATRSTNVFLWKRHKCPLLLQVDVSVILNGFDKTLFYGFLLKETDVMFSHGTFATATVITF